MFVQRKPDGSVAGIYRQPQMQPNGIDLAPEELPDDHPDIVAFIDRPERAAANAKKPLTEEDIKALIRTEVSDATATLRVSADLQPGDKA